MIDVGSWETAATTGTSPALKSVVNLTPRPVGDVKPGN